jgi:hypothetical protein
MMIYRRGVILILFAISGILQVVAQNIVYEKEDSMFIEDIAKRYPYENFQTRGDRIISIAKEFIGKKYVAGTLDRHRSEPLFISSTELDCTTAVELILAMAISKESHFNEICKTLEKIRYRNGIRDNYSSRLHYISWWINDSAKRNMVREVQTEKHSAEQLLKLDFMTRHTDSYPQLKNNPTLADSIAKYEKDFGSRCIKFIPKHMVKELCKSEINNGDIIAIVTNIKGLGVSHLGFAYWNNDVLHMIHASSNKKSIICDPQPLHNYLENSSSSLGIRVFRAL